MVSVPAGYGDLLERPLYGHLATTRPDGSVQVSPIWFDWDGELLRFAHTTKRQKYRNVQRDPRVAMSISDPDNPYRYLEVRGEVERIEPDRAARFFRRIANRYSGRADRWTATPWPSFPRPPRSSGDLLSADRQPLQRRRTSSRRAATGRGPLRRTGLGGPLGSPDRVQQALTQRAHQ